MSLQEFAEEMSSVGTHTRVTVQEDNGTVKVSFLANVSNYGTKIGDLKEKYSMTQCGRTTEQAGDRIVLIYRKL